MSHLIRRILGPALAIAVFLAPVCAFALDSVINDEEPGTIIIDYKDDIAGTEPVAGAKFKAYKAAEIGSSGQYIPIVEGIVIDETTTGSDVKDRVVEAYAKGQAGMGELTQTTDAAGIAVFNDLPHGLYLVLETKAADEHLPSEPVLVSVPYTEKASGGQAGEGAYDYWEYTARVFPKPHRFVKTKNTPTPTPQNTPTPTPQKTPTPTPKQKVTPTPKVGITPSPPLYLSPPRVKTGDGRRITVWAILIVGGLLVLILSKRPSGK